MWGKGRCGRCVRESVQSMYSSGWGCLPCACRRCSTSTSIGGGFLQAQWWSRRTPLAPFFAPSLAPFLARPLPQTSPFTQSCVRPRQQLSFYGILQPIASARWVLILACHHCAFRWCRHSQVAVVLRPAAVRHGGGAAGDDGLGHAVSSGANRRGRRYDAIPQVSLFPPASVLLWGCAAGCVCRLGLSYSH